MGEIWFEPQSIALGPAAIAAPCAQSACCRGGDSAAGSPTGLIRAKMGLAERIDAHLAWPSKPKGLFAAFNNPDGPPWLKQMVEKPGGGNGGKGQHNIISLFCLRMNISN